MQIDDERIKIRGLFPRIAYIEDEEIQAVGDPLAYLGLLKRKPLKADLFTFVQRLPETEPKYPSFHMEWDNIAAIPITTYEDWWTKQVNCKLRNMVRKLEKRGGEVRLVEYSDDFVKQIMDIYNETPIRQGRKFWHYHKPFEVVKKENGTYPERSLILGAYHEGRLIGFLRLIHEPAFATIIQIISMIRDRDKAPTNALLAKAVEVCAQRNIPYLIYAKYVYGRKGVDSLSEFKQHNGFIRIDLPRYYIPLTRRGNAALKMAIHHGLGQLLPPWLVVFTLNMRSKWYAKRRKSADGENTLNTDQKD